MDQLGVGFKSVLIRVERQAFSCKELIDWAKVIQSIIINELVICWRLGILSLCTMQAESETNNLLKSFQTLIDWLKSKFQYVKFDCTYNLTNNALQGRQSVKTGNLNGDYLGNYCSFY